MDKSPPVLVAPANHPVRLLDDYVARAQRPPTGRLAATALRTRSLAARHLLAHWATGRPLDELLAAVRGTPAASVPAISGGPTALAELARVVALQNVLPTDPEDGLALFELVLERFGPDQMPPLHQGIHAQLAIALGDHTRAAQLCAAYPRISRRVRWALELDLANPFTRPGITTQAEWLARFREMFPPPGPTVAAEADTQTTVFDRLAAPAPPPAGGPTVSVIVTSYLPDARLITSIRSLAAQSWADLEIILIDDGSPPEYDPILEQCVALDHRVRLVKLTFNGGTYVARNVGLDRASGAIINFQDSDDWSHPLRIEHQLGPLQEDQTIVATISDGVRADDQLRVGRPGRMVSGTMASSLMFRRDRVLPRIGYFDSVRKGADTEYQLRMLAAFGPDTIRRIDGSCYAVNRLLPGSLSSSEVGAGWIHPARAAYRSAYDRWHRRIKVGEASPYLPRDQKQRPFAASAHLAGLAGPAPTPTYDVVLASDWRQFGGPQKSMLEEIKALTALGMRVGIMQLESFRFMTEVRKPLCRQVQDAINDGLVDHVLYSDRATAALVMVRYPPVLQFPPSLPSNLRAGRVVIVANQAPSERDGTDQRYDPVVCTEVARQLFSAEPVWCPQGPEIRDMLTPRLAPQLVAPFDLPGIIDIRQWRVHRSRFRPPVPVLGRHARDNWIKWPGDRDSLLQVYPSSPDFDVRIMGGADVARHLLGPDDLPVNWLVYEYDEVSVRNFLYQLDFYVHFPHPNAVEAFGRSILEALATGCVAVLPAQFSRTFRDAAVYCAPQDVAAVVTRYHGDRDLFLEQSRLATERVEQWFSHEGHARRVGWLMEPDWTRLEVASAAHDTVAP
jgi:hypothetical protein